MEERNKLLTEDIERLKTRLTPDYLIDRTNIFNVFDRDRPMIEGINDLIAERFRDYWNTWIERDLKMVFDLILVGALAHTIINDKIFILVRGGCCIIPMDRSYKRFISNKSIMEIYD